MKNKILLFFIYLSCHNLIATKEFNTISLDEDSKDYFVHTNSLKFLIDSTSFLQKKNLFQNLEHFETSTIRNLQNIETEKKYWLYFEVTNKALNKNYILELYDFNVDEVSVFIFKNKKIWLENNSGYLSPFNDRHLDHKNFCYPIFLTHNDTLQVFMGLKSDKKSILKPVIKTHLDHTEYILSEYYTLGLFYGILILIAFYNLIYFFIIKEITYLFYVTYLLDMCFFFLSQDGLGFQYLWYNYPEINQYIETISLSLATISLLWFSLKFLNLDEQKSRIIYVVITLISVLFLTDLFFVRISIFRIILFICSQICLFLGIIDVKKNNAKNRWYILSFVLLNSFYLIELLENLDIISSSIFTVYSLNIGIVLQFISLSIGIAENSKGNLLEKNKALTELLYTKKENDALRLIELKRQMNPHFLFNALNSIQSRILVNNNEAASTLLIKFSQLLRKNLEISDVQFISFSEEIQLIINYLEIEKIRLGGAFNYEIIIDPLTNIKEEEIPTFLIQPLVENAIWHGFSKKNDDQFISVEFKTQPNSIEILIYDNGIGLVKKSTKEPRHKSKGLSIINERLELLERTFNKKITLELISPFKEGETGTLAKVTLWK